MPKGFEGFEIKLSAYSDELLSADEIIDNLWEAIRDAGLDNYISSDIIRHFKEG